MFFALVWLPEVVSKTRFSTQLPYSVFVGTVIIGSVSIGVPGLIPAMVADGNFTLIARGLNIVGGLGFLLAAINLAFVRTAFVSTDKTVFSTHAFLFGIAALLFELSALWDGPWWLWHVLRFVAYLIVVYYFLTVFLVMARELKEGHDNLELRVKERTAELLESEAQLEEAQKISHVGNWNWDIVSGDLRWSQEVFRMFGVNGEMTTSYDRFLSMIHPDDVEFVKHAVNRALEGNPYNIHHRIVLPDQTVRHVHERGEVKCDEDGTPVRKAGTVHDITDLKRTQQEIIDHRDHLEDLVAERTAKIQEQAKQLSEALESEKNYSALQQQFVSLVSHEFRTPLTIIDGTAQRIIRLKDKISPEQLVARSNKIRFAVERMVNLIETTLYASRLDAGKIQMHPQRCSIRELVSEVCDRQGEISPSHVILADLDDIPEYINADPKLLEHIFTNLLSNAVKYAPADPLITVTGEVNDGVILIAVKDQGLGISEDDLSHMFERYFRAKTSEGIRGTVLGLSVCQEFVEMHNGAITVDSVEGKGSTFTVLLPIGDSDL